MNAQGLVTGVATVVVDGNNRLRQPEPDRRISSSALDLRYDGRWDGGQDEQRRQKMGTALSGAGSGSEAESHVPVPLILVENAEEALRAAEASAALTAAVEAERERQWSEAASQVDDIMKEVDEIKV